MVENKKISSNQFAEFFGMGTNFYKETSKFLKKQAELDKSGFQKKFRLWRSKFNQIYGKEIGQSLFLKHSYYISILKVLILLNADTSVNKTIYDQFDLNELKFFFCPKMDEALVSEIRKFVGGVRLARQDNFHELYQQVFQAQTRHKIGEFYTPVNLVEKMINESYKIGLKTLDPSCGSGSFLVKLIVQIFNSNNSTSVITNAIDNIYGFDINPLATLTAKVNFILLFLDYFNGDLSKMPRINIFLIDSLFPEQSEPKIENVISKLNKSFDLIVGNPPWLTYKDINSKSYQLKIRSLSETLGIKPSSQYITHIEMASIFFFAIPLNFLKIKGIIFFVMPKSVLNGDHCFKFRRFSIFNKIEIWDFPNNYFFNVDHICLKAEYVGTKSEIKITEIYPIKARIFDSNLELLNDTKYSSYEYSEKGAKIIMPEKELKFLDTLSISHYKAKFFQGATLVPKSLVFFKIDKRNDNFLEISSDPGIIKRAKKVWKYTFQEKLIESNFGFKSFLNRDLIPFYIKEFKNVFLPVSSSLQWDENLLNNSPKALSFYSEINKFYKKNKKETSTIDTLYLNLNYWNKLTKQAINKQYIVVYNASGSRLKSTVIDNEDLDIVICSENYYFSTDSLNEAHYLCAIFNSPVLSKNIKLIKSSRHIHKRPFSFPIPLYDNDNETHRKLAKKSQKYQSIVQDLVSNNKNISSEKVRIFIGPKLIKLDILTKKAVFSDLN
ncbi:MAG: N-6 DNA methylase [Promethearchaeota archaeon]